MPNVRFLSWTPGPETASVHDLSSQDEIDRLCEFYGDTRPLRRVFEAAGEAGAYTAVAELRYIDADFRSIHERFYAGKFRRYPSVCHRLHFFGSRFDETPQIGNHTAAYIGYSVMQPLAHSPVGRTVLRPPQQFSDGVFCAVTDTANLFGWNLEVSGVPFLSQDQQLLRCAHAAQWVVLYHAYLRDECARSLPGDVHDASGAAAPVDRTLPSHGLGPHQLVGGLERLGLSPAVLDTYFRNRRQSEQRRYLSLFATLCRLVNSQIPPIIMSNDHAWVVVGYRINALRSEHDAVELIYHDDTEGPYLLVSDPWTEQRPRQRWAAAVAPYPRKIHLPAEKAEAAGRYWLPTYAAPSDDDVTNQLHEAIQAGRVHYRTYAVLSSRFKRDLREKRTGVPEKLVTMYCFSQWPRFVWVVEAVDNDLRGDTTQGDEGPCVLGEAVFDATDHPLADELDLLPLAIHVAGEVVLYEPDHEAVAYESLGTFKPYASGCSSDRLP